MNAATTSSGLDAFLKYLHEVEQDYHIAEAEEQEASSITQDILHDIELRDHTYHENANLTKELKASRVARRKAKDKMDAAGPILSWVENHRATVKELEQLLGVVRKAERNAEGRIYTPRVRR